MDGDVIILASGPSVKAYNLRGLEERGKLLTVNGSGLYVKPHLALTMDRLVAEHCHPLWQVQGVPEVWIRASVVQNFSPGPNVTLFDHDYDRPDVLAEIGYLNGSNSSVCALNLAYQWRCRRVFLLGFDMQRGPANEPYWHPPYPWNMAGAAKNGRLAEWAKEFQGFARQFQERRIKVFNVNHRTLIEAFPVISYSEFKAMT